jgi:cysteine-rich repeat protein
VIRTLLAFVSLLSLLLAATPALAVCGDGILDPDEQCDDLNADPGDGCDADCQIESGWECVDASFEIDFAEIMFDSEWYPDPDWDISDDGLTVYQWENADPAVYVTQLPANGVSVTFDLTVNADDDDDFIGWVIGYEAGDATNEDCDWLLFDWKQWTQDWDEDDETQEDIAWQGLAFSRVTGAIDDETELYGHIDSVTEISRANTLGDVGWPSWETTRVRIDYTTAHFDVYVDGTLEFSEDGTFPDGNFGFYNFSQDSIEYTLLSPIDQSVCSPLDLDENGIPDYLETDEVDDGDGAGGGCDCESSLAGRGGVLSLLGLFVGLLAIRRRR